MTRHRTIFERIAAAVGLSAAAALIYSRVAGFDFAWDDRFLFAVREVRAGLTPAGLTWAFRESFGGNWMPLTLLSHMLDVEVFGLRPGGHHIVNVLLHGMNAVLLYLLLDRATGASGRSFAAAALFAIHPLHVESVAWVSERKDVLSTLFGLWSLLFYLWHARRPSAVRLGLSLAAFACGLMAKATLATLPFLLLVLDLWPLRRLRSRPGGGLAGGLLEKAPFFGLAAACGAIAYRTQAAWGAIGTGPYYTLPARAANAITSYAWYLGKTVWPVSLSVFYPFRPVTAWRAGLAVTLVVLLTALGLARWRRAPALAVGWLWYLAALAPVAGFLQVGGQSTADRYAYVPLIGPFVAAVWGFALLGARVAWGRQALAAAALAATAALGTAAVVQVETWRNDLSLFGHAVRVTRNNQMAHNNLGAELQRRGRTAEALEQFRAAVRAQPFYPDARLNLARTLDRLGRPAEAEEHYRAALVLIPGNPEILRRLERGPGR